MKNMLKIYHWTDIDFDLHAPGEVIAIASSFGEAVEVAAAREKSMGYGGEDRLRNILLTATPKILPVEKWAYVNHGWD